MENEYQYSPATFFILCRDYKMVKEAYNEFLLYLDKKSLETLDNLRSYCNKNETIPLYMLNELLYDCDDYANMITLYDGTRYIFIVEGYSKFFERDYPDMMYVGEFMEGISLNFY